MQINVVKYYGFFFLDTVQLHETKNIHGNYMDLV